MSRVVDQALAFQRRAVKAEAERDEARAEADRLRAERDDALSIIPAHALVQQNADLLREVERLRGWLREFAHRIERDRREPDKVLIEATSMRAIADDLREGHAPARTGEDGS